MRLASLRASELVWKRERGGGEEEEEGERDKGGREKEGRKSERERKGVKHRARDTEEEGRYIGRRG